MNYTIFGEKFEKFKQLKLHSVHHTRVNHLDQRPELAHFFSVDKSACIHVLLCRCVRTLTNHSRVTNTDE